MEHLADYERAFRRAGLPLFIEDYSAAEAIFNRAVPLLGLVFIGEVLLALDEHWGPLANLGAVLGGLAILLVTIGVANKIQGRPFRARPERVGKTELAIFVIVPALLPLIFGQQIRQSALTVVANVIVLWLIYLVVGLALISTLRWALVRLVNELASSLALLTRAVPLLLVFALLLVMTNEMWQVFGDLPPLFLLLITAFFALIGTVFLGARLPREVTDMEASAAVKGPPLTRRQRLNVGVVIFVSQALQILLASLAVGLFFIVFGFLAVTQKVQVGFIGHGVHVWLRLTLGGHEIVITQELVRLSWGLAAFSGLYYAISVLNDPAYRAEFLEEVTGQLRETLELRVDYLEKRRGVAGIDLRAFLPPEVVQRN